MNQILKRANNPEQTQHNYNRVTWFYDFWGRVTEAKAARKVLELADIKDGMQIIETACGTGVVLEQILEQNPSGHTVGFDLSSGMLELAKRRIQKGNYSHYELTTGDVLNMNYPNDSFDLLINNFMVDLMPEDSFGLIASEYFRILKPNGRAVISTFSFGTKPVHKLWYYTARAFPNLLAGCRPVRFAPYLEQAGFQVAEVIEISQNTFPSQIIKAIKK